MNRLKALYNFQLHNKIVNTTLFLLYASIVTGLSVSPNVNISMVVNHQDKIYHIIAYSVFTFLGWRLTQTRKKFTIIALSILCYGGIIEYIQSLTGRTMSALDFIANGIGIGLVALIIHLISLTTTSRM
jgi:VanZ family protein